MRVTPYRYTPAKVPARLHIPANWRYTPAHYILAFDRLNNLVPGVGFTIGGTTYRGF
jgi:hypothetical protein